MLIFILIVFAIIGWAVSSRLKSKFRKYSQTPLSSGMSGREVAERMLADHGIRDVKVISVAGQLTDHYNPLNKTVNLSEPVYHGRNAAAAAVAAHECGHAVQHATAYSMLQFRSAMVPVQSISARIINFVMIASLFGFFTVFTSIQPMLLILIGAYGVITLFSLVTLPVEFDASKRALAWINQRGIVTSQEHSSAKDALNWAAMTYVVAALGSLVTLVYFVMMFLGGRD